MEEICALILGIAAVAGSICWKRAKDVRVWIETPMPFSWLIFGGYEGFLKTGFESESNKYTQELEGIPSLKVTLAASLNFDWYRNAFARYQRDGWRRDH